MNECCGNCKHYKPMTKDAFVCDNEESEDYGLETTYDDYCGEFEEREG